MRFVTRAGLVGTASAFALTGASFGDQSVNETESLRAEVAALRAEVARLGENHDQLSQQRSEEIRSLVQDVLADADTRASLLQNGMTAGYDNGFVIGSADGNFSLRLNGQIQVRFNWNNQDNSPYSLSMGGLADYLNNLDTYAELVELAETGTVEDVEEFLDDLGFVEGDDDRWGFENTRTKLIFSGHVVNPQWLYYIEGNFGRACGAFDLEDAWIGHDFENGWKVLLGQYKAPHTREWNVHSMNQLAVERSNVNYFYNGGRVQGIAVDFSNDTFHFVGSFNDGAHSANSPWSVEDTEWSLSARVELLLNGTWDQFKDFTSPRGSEQGFLIGGGIHYQSFEYGTSLTLDQLDLLILTGDISWEGDGFNLFASINYLDIDTIDSNPLGFTAQGGYYFSDTVEGFARYEWNDFDAVGVEDWSLLTLGINAYYNANVKTTLDIGYAFDAVPVAFDITGWRPDTVDEDGQFVFRTQMQLTF